MSKSLDKNINKDYIGQSIEPYSPLSRTMCLLDTIEQIGETSFTASVLLDSSSSFVEGEGVPAWIGIEYMAQAIAAFAGVKAHQNNGPIQIGFLLGSRKFISKISEYPLAEKIEVQVSELLQDESGLGVFDCQIRLKEKVVASAKLNVFQPVNPMQFIKEQAND